MGTEVGEGGRGRYCGKIFEEFESGVEDKARASSWADAVEG